MILDKTDFEATAVLEIESTCNGWDFIHQEEVTVLNLHVLNDVASKYMKKNQQKSQEEMDKSIVVGDYWLLSIIGRWRSSKLRKGIENLNQTVNNLDVIEQYSDTIQMERLWLHLLHLFPHQLQSLILLVTLPAQDFHTSYFLSLEDPFLPCLPS